MTAVSTPSHVPFRELHVAATRDAFPSTTYQGPIESISQLPSLRARTTTTRRAKSIFSRQGSLYYDPMPQHIAAVLKTTPALRKDGGIRKASNMKKRAMKRMSLLQALPPADTISPTTPIDTVLACQPFPSFIIEKRPPFETAYPSSECLPLSAGTLGRTLPSPRTPLPKDDSKARIGLWRENVVNGAASGDRRHNDPRVNPKVTQHDEDWPLRTSQATRRRSSKPTLSVVIPDSWSPKTKTAIKRICQDFAATATTPAVSKFNITAHILPSAMEPRRNKLGFTSPLVDDTDVPATAPADMAPNKFTNKTPSPRNQSNPSRNGSNASTEQSYSDSDGSSYSRHSSKSSRTSVDSSDDSHHQALPPAWKGTRGKGKKPTKPLFAALDPTSAGVFDSPKLNLNKPLPASPGPEPEIFDPSRSWSSLSRASPEPTTVRAGTKAEASWPAWQKPYMKPTNPTNWKPIRVKTTKSCKSLHKLDKFDDEFMKTDPYVSSTPTSPSLSEAASELQDKLCEIRPLQIRRQSRQSVRKQSDTSVHSSEDEDGIPGIKVTRTGSESSTASAASAVPSIPPRSSLRAPKRPSEQDDSILSPTSDAERRRSASGLSKRVSSGNLKVAVNKANRRRSGSDVKKEDTLSPLRIFGANTPVTARRVDPSVPLLPALTPIPRLLSPRTPSARISILIPSTLDDENTCSLTGLDERWQPTSPMRFQTARAAAETALLRIMASLPSLDDLANTAVINKGMRRVFKQNELSLLRAVLRNQNAAAWELREWSPPPSPNNVVGKDPDDERTFYTALTYKSHATRDASVVASLKPMMIARCGSFLRPMTVSALGSSADKHAARFDLALYRIWCFCKIFGSGKHREDDITGQIDWLKGGVLAHAQEVSATVNTNLEFDMSSVLLNPPEYFGSCNAGGLSAEDIFDMTELWNCLAALLQDYVGKTTQARLHGVFDPCNIPKSDVEAECQALEEWIHHILTLGPAAVLKLAELGETNTNSGFALAALNGWMEWTPPSLGNSRGTFLREPLCRLYGEEASTLTGPSVEERKRKELDRKRVATMAAEIRAARCTSGYKRLPLIDMANERPMSLFSRMTGSRESVASSSTLVGRTPTAASPQTAFPRSPLTAQKAMGSHERVREWRKRISPIAEEEQHQQQHYIATPVFTAHTRSQSEVPRLVDRPVMHRLRTNSTDMAVQNVVAMGFTPNQAREALKQTDRGDGMHVDRAVDWLLRHSP